MPNGRRKKFRVHRLVAESFVENPHGLSWVNHINGDKSDNRSENLEWVTPHRNTMHSLRSGLQKTKLNETQVRVIRHLRGHMAYAEIGRLFGVSGQFARDVAIGRHMSWVEG